MDAKDFTGFLRRHAGLIHRIVYAYHRAPSDREDVVQEVALQLWRSRERYDASFREATWVSRIAVNVAISALRRERRHRDGRESLEQASLFEAAPVEEPGEDVQRLMGCIDALGPLDRALIVLHLEGLDHASIADVVGTSRSNVGTRLHRIRKELRRAFGQSAANEQEIES